MGVQIDQARGEQQAGDVHHLGAVRRYLRPDLGDPARSHADVEPAPPPAPTSIRVPPVKSRS